MIGAIAIIPQYLEHATVVARYLKSGVVEVMLVTILLSEEKRGSKWETRLRTLEPDFGNTFFMFSSLLCFDFLVLCVMYSTSASGCILIRYHIFIILLFVPLLEYFS